MEENRRHPLGPLTMRKMTLSTGTDDDAHHHGLIKKGEEVYNDEGRANNKTVRTTSSPFEVIVIQSMPKGGLGRNLIRSICADEGQQIRYD